MRGRVAIILTTSLTVTVTVVGVGVGVSVVWVKGFLGGRICEYMYVSTCR